MSTMADIAIQATHDPNVKVYHTRFELSSGPERGGRGDVDEVGAFGRLVLEVRGVVQVHVFPYLLMATKGDLFEWSEIDPKIEALLRQFAVSQRQLESVNVGPGEDNPLLEASTGR
jgi:hypothetical protein